MMDEEACDWGDGSLLPGPGEDPFGSTTSSRAVAASSCAASLLPAMSTSGLSTGAGTAYEALSGGVEVDLR